jgi:D-serine deaminase-like pyridoxal phosphate-dependent protein
VKLEDLQTPALLIRLDRVRANVRRMGELLQAHGGIGRWRPHTKTAKVPQVLALLLEAGIRRFKTATTRETAVLLEEAARAKTAIDVLIAMPHLGANLARVAELARKHRRQRVSILTEHPDHARRARELGLELFVDLDPRMGRTGIPFEQRDRIAATIAACGDGFRGLHAYEGHVRDRTESDRERACAPLFEALARTAREQRVERGEVVTSGTPTFVEALKSPALADLRSRFASLETTVSPGIVVYWDRNSAALGIEGFSFAATVLARVISASQPDRCTLDAGSKSLDAAAGDPCVEIDRWPNLSAQKPSEEHLPVLARHGVTPRPGELVELVPRHVCPMVNLASSAVLLEGDEIASVVPVAAQGHET